MQSLVASGLRLQQLKSLAVNFDNFGANRSAKDGKVLLNFSKGSSLRSCPLPSSVAVNCRRSWKIYVSTQDEMNSEDILLSTTQDDSKSPHKEQGPPLVKVKFVLQKKCKFGQQFCVVGDDAQFGTWDPKLALSLEWSEGDTWTTEVNVPVGKQIEYKFILRGKSGEISWQPDPNRVFETLETVPSMVVSSQWEEEVKSLEITEQGIVDKIPDANLGERISLNATSGQSVETVDAISDTSNGVFMVSTKNAEEKTEGEPSAIGFSGLPDVVGPSNGTSEERGAASPSEAM